MKTYKLEDLKIIEASEESENAEKHSSIQENSKYRRAVKHNGHVSAISAARYLCWRKRTATLERDFFSIAGCGGDVDHSRAVILGVDITHLNMVVNIGLSYKLLIQIPLTLIHHYVHHKDKLIKSLIKKKEQIAVIVSEDEVNYDAFAFACWAVELKDPKFYCELIREIMKAYGIIQFGETGWYCDISKDLYSQSEVVADTDCNMYFEINGITYHAYACIKRTDSIFEVARPFVYGIARSMDALEVKLPDEIRFILTRPSDKNFGTVTGRAPFEPVDAYHKLSA